MESNFCMNAQCGASTSGEWRKGWPMRSGDFASLCDKCGFLWRIVDIVVDGTNLDMLDESAEGHSFSVDSAIDYWSAYEQLIYCDVFHLKESGWRECASCGKRLHCGCIASRSTIEFLDFGGVNCSGCSKQNGLISTSVNGKSNGLGFLKVDSVKELCSLDAEGHFGTDAFEKLSLKHLFEFQTIDPGQSFARVKQEEVLPSSSLDILKHHIHKKDTYDVPAQPNLSISLGSSVKPGPFHDTISDEKGKTTSIFQQTSRSRQLLPKPPNGGMVPQMRVARPPAEGRGKTQLLPRYWPRITDQELQQISGDPNSTIVPLFEKVLSASDAGRIGRLVLPKACAEAYFPPISQPEGLPLRIQDIKGKEWVFQFRFWPNNNSRMYVLEGVTPCIQSMQLQAGDTVTFSRMEPEGKLVMGFRKATNSPTLQSFKGSSETHLNTFLNSTGGGVDWEKFEKHMTKENIQLQSMLVPDKKRARNIGLKNKRLLIDSIDALELRLTWEEAQDLLRPPPSALPSIVTIEDHDFEEYDEPPVFGKRSVFVMRSTGEQEQWAQCDVCAKWRKLPIEVLLAPKWTCSDNIWDSSRSICSAPDELSPRELETLLRLDKEFKRRRVGASEKPNQELEPSPLDTLANVAITGDNMGEQMVTTVAATTKHPRHRPGCSCIVCIQPPSGKGKHKPSCTCTVCQTVKRRFKTLMMRKRKNQADQEAEIAQRSQHTFSESRDETEADSVSKHHLSSSENEDRTISVLPQSRLSETGGGHIDLNSHPERGEDPRQRVSGVSMLSLLQAASLPWEAYLKQNVLKNSSASENQQAPSMSLQAQPQATTTAENDEQGLILEEPASATQEKDNDIDETQPDQIQKE